jgi:hypothetical protein
LYYNTSSEDDRESILVEIGELENNIRRDLGKYSDFYTVTKPIKTPRISKPYIQLRIKWNKFIEYLDHLAVHLT